MHLFAGLLAAVLQAATPSALVPPLDEVGAIVAAGDNDARFEAVTSLLRAHNLSFTIEPFDIDRPVGAEPRTRGRNIIVALGDGPTEIIVGAHYDAARLPDGSLSRAAVDDAAGCVVLIRAAEALRSERLAVRVKFIWFDMEELGLVGSAKYVEAHAGDRIRAMLNFDIDAYGDTIVFSHPPGGEDAALRRTLLETCAAQDLACSRFPSLPNGDDRPFGRAAIPTISIASLMPIEMHQMWLLMNAGVNGRLVPGTIPDVFRTVHTANDQIAKVDGATIDRMQRLAVALVARLAQNP